MDVLLFLLEIRDSARCNDMYREEQRGTDCTIHSLNAYAGYQLLTHDMLVDFIRLNYSKKTQINLMAGRIGFSPSAVSGFLIKRYNLNMKHAFYIEQNESDPESKFNILRVRRTPNATRFIITKKKHSTCLRKCKDGWCLIDSENYSHSNILIIPGATEWDLLKGCSFYVIVRFEITPSITIDMTGDTLPPPPILEKIENIVNRF